MVTSRSRPGLINEENVAGVNLHRVWMPARSPAGWAAHVAATLPTFRRLAEEADVFHAHTFACGVPAVLTRRRRRPPYVLTLHTSHFLMRARSPVWRRIFRPTIAAADFLLATSEEILDVALGLYPHRRSEVMTNAVDTARFAPPPAALKRDLPRLVVPRRLFPKNGVEFFVRALPLILDELDVDAHSVGDGPDALGYGHLK